MLTPSRPLGRTLAAVCLVATAVVGSAAHAGDTGWRPQKNVELVIGAQAAGANDRMGRILQKILTETDTAPISMSVMNKPGQGQSVGVAYVNSHPGDPHYLVILGSSWVTTAITTRSTTTHRDLTPIVKLVDTDLVMFVPAESALRNVKDVVDTLKKGAPPLSFGFSTAAGNASHIALAQIARYADTDPRKLRVVVNASGSITATQIAGNHISVGLSSSGSASAMVAVGKARLIGTLSDQRLPRLPDLPTLAEQGYKVVAPTWFTVFGPKGLQPSHVAYWEASLTRAMLHAEAKRFVESNNWSLAFVGAGELPKLLDAQYDRLRTMLVDLGMVKE